MDTKNVKNNNIFPQFDYRIMQLKNMNEIKSFKESFKYFKRKHSSEVTNNVLNISAHDTPECSTILKKIINEYTFTKCDICVSLGLKSHQEWHVYEFKDLNGFFYVSNPFTPDGQHNWVRKCLAQYTRKPSVTNLDLHHSDLDDIWSLYQEGKSTFVDRLTWATLGFHYNWEEKIYNEINHSPFPDCLGGLVKHIASCLNFKTFEPDAAIINYYNTKSTLGIHNDHSEVATNKPIVSVSFGLTAIFLMGTEQIDEKPLPLFLKSGDIVILSGQSRLAYHAVPAVLGGLDWDEDSSQKPFEDYIKQHRINISVRQVYPVI